MLSYFYSHKKGALWLWYGALQGAVVPAGEAAAHSNKQWHSNSTASAAAYYEHDCSTEARVRVQDNAAQGKGAGGGNRQRLCCLCASAAGAHEGGAAAARRAHGVRRAAEA